MDITEILRKIGDVAVGTPETALSLASGAIAYPAAKLGGALTSAMTGGRGDLAQYAEDYITDKMTYKPTSQSGQEAMNIAGSALSIPYKPAEYVKEKYGYIPGYATEMAINLLMPRLAGRWSEMKAKGLGESGLAGKNVIKPKPTWKDIGELANEGDTFERVVWGVKKGQDINTHDLPSLGVESQGKGIHVGDVDYWTERLAEDYGRNKKDARPIVIRARKGDALLEDPQYMTDPDTGIKAESNILATKRGKLKYGKDWVFKGERFADDPAPVIKPISNELRALYERIAVEKDLSVLDELVKKASELENE